VVEDKWLATLAASVQSELDRVSQGLTGRVRELAERYGTPLPQAMSQVEALEKRVAGHWVNMGFLGASLRVGLALGYAYAPVPSGPAGGCPLPAASLAQR